MKTQQSETRRRRSNSSSFVRRTAPLLLPAQCDAFERQLIDLVKGFTADVSESVALNEVLFKNHLPQRCLKHNNVLTLYCEKDRTPLCVSCVYHGNQHKTHKVIPLKNAGKSLLTDTQNYANKVQRRIEEIDGILRVSTENIVKIEKIYPEVCRKIELGFKQLHDLLSKKEEEHIKDLYLLTEKLRSNHLVLIEEMTKLLNIFVDKGTISHSADEDLALFKRSILSTILESDKYVQVEVKSIEFNHYPQYSSAMFVDLQRTIIERLQLRSFPQIIVLNQQQFQPEALSKIVENLEASRPKEDNKLSKSQLIPKFKMSGLGRGSNMSPVSARRSRRE